MVQARRMRFVPDRGVRREASLAAGHIGRLIPAPGPPKAGKSRLRSETVVVMEAV